MSQSKRMREENKVNSADKIDNRRRRTDQTKWTAAQTGQNILDSQLHRRRHARVMATKGMQLMRVRCGDERLIEFFRHPCGPPVRIKRTLVEMAKLDRIEAIDLFEQELTD